MVKNTSSGELKKPEYSLRSGLAKEYSGDRYQRQNEQRDRWLAEHRHHEAVEKALADLGKFSYDPEDYVRLLVKEPFVEPLRKDFSQLLPERLREAEQRYRKPINTRLGVMAALIVSVAVLPSLVTLAVVLVLLGIMGYGQFKILKERQRVLTDTETRTRQEIAQMTQAQEEAIAAQRKEHDEAEEERISFYVQLLNGDESTMINVIDETFSKLRLPFPMDVDIDLHAGIILIRAWLPFKSVIPHERTLLLPESGRIQYEKKESTEINKQYAELCAAILMQLSTLLYAKVPNIEKTYVWGMSKEGDEDACILAFQLNRQAVMKVATASTALLALQGLGAMYSCDEFLKMLPMEVAYPVEWEAVERKALRSLHIKIYR